MPFAQRFAYDGAMRSMLQERTGRPVCAFILPASPAAPGRTAPGVVAQDELIGTDVSITRRRKTFAPRDTKLRTTSLQERINSDRHTCFAHGAFFRGKLAKSG